MIDWARVQELRDEIGPEDFAEVACMFLEEADEVVASLRAGIAVEKVEAALHYLKGSALNLGFWSLAELCQKGESAASAGVGNTVDLANIVKEYDVSKQAFSSGLNKKFAA